MQLSFRTVSAVPATRQNGSGCMPSRRASTGPWLAPPARAMSPEEEEFYEARLKKKKADRQAAIQDAKRRAKFDPSDGQRLDTAGDAAQVADSAPPSRTITPEDRRARVKAAEQEHMRQQLAMRQEAHKATVEAMKPKPATSNAPPPNPPAQSRVAAQKQVPVRPAPKRVAQVEDEDIDDFMDLDASDDDDDEDDDDLDDLASVVSQLMEEEAQGTSSVPQVKRQPVAQPVARRRPVAAPGAYKPGLGTKGNNVRASPVANQGASKPSVRQPVKPQAPAPVQPDRLEADPVVPDLPDLPNGADMGKDLDWDALEAFESYEKYTDKLEEEDAKVQALAERAARTSDQASTSTLSAASTTSDKPKKAPKMDAIDELEQLVKFFELVEKSEETKAAGPAGPTAAAASKAELRKMEADIDWSTIERLMMGQELDQQFDELKQKMAKDAGIDPKMLEEDYVPEASGEGGLDDEPWSDEVSSMLVSLVLMSHRRYLSESLPGVPEDVKESARAKTVWESDIPVLVQDDSTEMALEYGNKKALELLGMDFEDLFEKTSLQVVDDDPTCQQDWIFSTTEANDNFEKFVVIPALRLRGSQGTALLAKDVLVHRVDSLDGGPVGLAIVFRGPVTQA